MKKKEPKFIGQSRIFKVTTKIGGVLDKYKLSKYQLFTLFLIGAISASRMLGKEKVAKKLEIILKEGIADEK